MDPKSFPFISDYIGPILHFLLLHIKVLRKQPSRFETADFCRNAPRRTMPYALTNFRCVRNTTHRIAPHRIGVSRPSDSHNDKLKQMNDVNCHIRKPFTI